MMSTGVVPGREMNASKQGGHRRRKGTPKAVARVEKAVKETFDEAAAEPVPDRLVKDAERVGRLIRQKTKGAAATGKCRGR